MNRGFWVVMAAMLSLVACQSLADGAKEQFSKDYSCPLERVESRDRRDLQPSSFLTPSPMPKPPADVAADPARLALWQQNHRQDSTGFDSVHDVEEARGCGKEAFYECYRYQKHATRVGCGSVPQVPAGISRWAP
jgi:hypothetical protein